MGLGKEPYKLVLIRLLTSLVLVLGGFSAPLAVAIGDTDVQALSADLPARYYPETGKTLASEFVRFYDLYGGVLQFGYPLTEAHMENGYLVQWTERQRLEYHPENAESEYEVLLGLLGRDLTAGLTGSRFAPEGSGVGGAENLTVNLYSLTPGRYFEETGHSVAEPFLSYWQKNGGLRVYGYPVSEAFTENGLLVQWFERARFESHPESVEHPVLLGLLGVEGLKRAGESEYKVAIADKSVPDGKLEVDLAQGGESEDPHFLDNVRDSGRELGPGLVRLDNIYNFYGIVQRGAGGEIHYDWSKLDIALAGVRAMGKEPMICLSYMPETMSATGMSRVTPPKEYEEWGALVRATVEHVNGVQVSKFKVQGGISSLNFEPETLKSEAVRYWEVWNEPDQTGFWLGSYEDYLKLYDVTLAAIKSADPEAKVGGPGVSYFSPNHLRVFLSHEALMAQASCSVPGEGCGNGEGGANAGSRVDFMSWHEYGRTPEGLEEDIKGAREVVRAFPQFSPELFVTEFNVKQGGAGDTSAGGYTDRVEGAIGVMRSIEVMEREGLDRGFLFELKDGAGPAEYWGRWGALTNGGARKPVYYALREWAGRPAGRLPVNVVKGATDGTLGVMAYGGGGAKEGATIFLWYTGAAGQAHVKVELTHVMTGESYDVYLFDGTHNNPASKGGGIETGGDRLEKLETREGGDLDLDLQPESLVIIKLVR